jgi:hypothetical protein
MCCAWIRKSVQNFFVIERACAEKERGRLRRKRMREKKGHDVSCPYNGIKLARLFFLGDVNDYLSGDVAEDFDGDGIFA